MTFAPPTLTALAGYWIAHGGVNLGIVGDAGHVGRGVSYHLGADQLQPDAYSARTARDRAGLSNAASAIDLGRLDGSLARLQAFSRELVAIARANAPGTADMREIIYSPDGATVLRWDRERGFASAPRPGEADNTHLTHTHISWYRDAERRDHTIAFRSILEGSSDVQTTVTLTPYPARAFKSKAGLATLRRFNAAGELAAIAAAPGFVDADVRIDQSDGRVPHGTGFLRLASGTAKGSFILAAQVDVVIPPPLDCAPAIKAAVNTALDHVAAATAAVPAAIDQARIR